MTESSNRIYIPPPYRIENSQDFYDQRVVEILTSENKLSPALARALLVQMCRTAINTKKQVDSIHRGTFKEFLAEFDNQADKLASLKDKSSPEYKSGFTALASEIEKRIAEFPISDDSDQSKAATKALLDFLDERFSDGAIDPQGKINPGNIVIATILLRSNQGIIVDIIRDQLAAERDVEAAQNLLNTIESARLSEDRTIFNSLRNAAIEGLEDYSDHRIRARIVDNLIALSPGSSTEAKAEYLLRNSLEQEQNILGEYESLIHERMLLSDEAGDTLILDSGTEDQKKIELENSLESTKESIIASRRLISELYRSPDIKPYITEDAMLNLLDQTNPIETLSEEEFKDLYAGIKNETITKLFDTDILKSSLVTALKFAKDNTNKLTTEQIKTRLEAVIKKLDYYPSLYLEQLTSSIDLYYKYFTNSSQSTAFLMNLLNSPDASDYTKYRITEKIADSKIFNTQLGKELQGDKWQNLAMLFAIADALDEPFKPLINFLNNINDRDLISCVNKLNQKPLFRIEELDDEDDNNSTFTKAKILSIIAKQFNWENADDPISIKLVKYLTETGEYEYLQKDSTTVARFINYLISKSNPKTPIEGC